ncbi:uncharacterized protein KGF55_001473 [Candida pseudojiufengensis]|uniref:uncharacterized protein n=1 Tax=Candida pseudojiufengensis TaxID=497109 RepID=UPI0022254BBE|nr:uncharacterized protein KGF55_001473 [Candida pseudojiufengensis]KAI5965253.1 hypothetical protein KGF55_001473 [Candida pseudojiufengensis]
MSKRYRELISYDNLNVPNASSSTLNNTAQQHTELRQYNEFQTSYFKLQSIINKKVNVSLKYEQLKTPEIHSALIKPISHEIISVVKENGSDSNVSVFTVYILLLLKYEYLIQSENNLIQYDLLISRSHVCELMSIRMLREYSSIQRIQVLFVKPPRGLISLAYGFDYNTLELCILSKSKSFLSQPIIVQILNKFYNGDLIHDDVSQNYTMAKKCTAMADTEKTLLNHRNYESYNSNNNKLNYDIESNQSIFQRHGNLIVNVYKRINIVPKHQNIIINLKLIIFAINYFILTQQPTTQPHLSFMEILFWLIGLNFNFEILTKFRNINFRFLNLILWNHIDFFLICILNFCFILRFCITDQSYFNDFFSLIGIILFPRILSIFNNYKFFNLIILSFHKMFLNLVGLVLMFFTLISGFYFCFLKLSNDQTPFEILFNMVKVFFGFTPSIWNYWDDFNTLGKIMQMCYLFLIQFIIGTILAICLSGIFNKTRENIEYEFNYFKSNNLIIYFKCSELNQRWSFTNVYCQIFKTPVILLILIYGIFSSFIVKFKNVAFTAFTGKYAINKHSYEEEDVRNLKNFTFINKPDFDHELNFKPSINLRKRKPKNKIIKNYQSVSTLGCNGNHLRTASTDSFFIDQLLNRKYGGSNSNNINTNDESVSRNLESNRLFSKKFQESKQPNQSLSGSRSNQKSSQIPRYKSILQNSKENSHQPSVSQISSSYSAIQMHQSQILQQSQQISNTSTIDQILSRLVNLETLLTKFTAIERIEDDKLIILNQLNQIKSMKTIESDNLSINSSSNTDIDSLNDYKGQPFEIDNIYEDINEDDAISNENDSKKDSADEDEDEFDKTLPLRFHGVNRDLNDDFDQYDSDNTF